MSQEAPVCGHERGVLAWVLRATVGGEVCGDDVRQSPYNDALNLALRAADDPTKLAAIMAALFLARGDGAHVFGVPEQRRNLTPNAPPGFQFVDVVGAKICVRFTHAPWLDRDMDMPTARAFALALLTASGGVDIAHLLKTAGGSTCPH